MLAKNVNDNAVCLVIRGVLRFFASKLAPAGYLPCGVIYPSFVLSQCLASSFVTEERVRNAKTVVQPDWQPEE
ncbi:hypothetical protein C4J98_4115 [Pseudomonas orientalis]|nr:hypothetical protein C4J98_4115 [Pseudomonas orientalis]